MKVLSQSVAESSRRPKRATRPALRPIAYCVALACCELAAAAQPTGPIVVNGTAPMQGAGTSHLRITNSPGAIINWQGFSIASGNTTEFIQQSASSAVLNRVVGDPSRGLRPEISNINGQLLSNGRVFLINPAGIVIGAGGVIDTAGFVGSTLNMQNADFLAGKLKFQAEGVAGSITNDGKIFARHGGDIVLIAPQIENGASGALETEGGQLILAAGRKLSITSARLEGVEFEVQAPGDSVVNVGKLLADGGAVGVFAGTLKHSGDIRANALARDEAGRIVLRAKDDITLTASSTTQASGATGGAVTISSGSGTTIVSGTIEAKGDAGKGGDVRVLGERAGVIGGALVDVSGEAGGGQILVGGDYQGRNPDVQNASRALVGPNATLRADAGRSGDGGKVIVWADGDTRFDGTIEARGGTLAGNGGFIETSGKAALSVGDARVDATAPAGRNGTWLLDPKFIIVQAGGGATLVQVDEFIDTPAGALTISPATIAAAGADVVLQANSDITFASDLVVPTTRSLTAQAGRSIFVNANITGADGPGIFLTANETAANGVQAAQRDGTGTDPVNAASTIRMAPGTAITYTGGGDVVLRMGSGLGDPTKPSGNIVVERIVSDNAISIVHNGPTPGGSILRASTNSLLQASDGVNLQIVNPANGGPASIGASGAPIRTDTPALEAYTQATTGGIFLASTRAGAVNIGGTTVNVPGARGVQTLAGGPIEITAAGALNTLAGACGPGGAGGPVCAGPSAGAASALDAANTVTLRGTDVVLGGATRGRTVNLVPPAGNPISLTAGGRVGFSVVQTDIDQVDAGLLRIGEDASGAVTFVSTPPGLNVPLARAAALEIRTGSTILGDAGAGVGNDLTVAGPLTLSAASIGNQAGTDDLFITPGSTVSATATTGDIFIRHITGTTGRLRLSDYPTLSVAAGRTARLTHAGPGTAIPTLDRNVDMAGRTLTLAGFGTTTNVEVEGSPTVNAGQVNFSGNAIFYNGGSAGTATFNAPLTITNTATFSGGTTHFNQAATVQNAGAAALTLAAGTIAGDNNLTVTGGATWSGGGFAGGTGSAGSTTINGPLTMNGGAKTFAQRTLTVTGATTWSAGNVTNVDGGTFNANGGLVIQDALQWTGAGAATTINIPVGQTLTRNGAAGTVMLDRATIDNFGGVSLGANTGELRLSSGLTIASTGNLGAVAVGAGSTLHFAGGTYGSVGAVSGAGAVTVSAGDVSFGGTFSNTNTLNVSGGLARFQVATAPSPGTVNVSGGTLLVAVPMTFGGGTLSNGTLSVANAGNMLTLTSGGFDWSGGTLTGGGTFIVNPAAQLDVTGAAATHTMSTSAQIRNDGIMTWAGILQGTNGANVITNNNRLDVLGDATLSRAGPGTIAITNSAGANFNKNVSGTLTFDTNATFDNNGTVTVGAGVMNLNGGGSHDGTFNANTFLTFGGGIHTLTGTSNIGGTGNVGFTAGTVNVGGAFDLNNAAGSASISGGTVNFNGATPADFGSVLTMTGGTLSGAGAVTHPGTFNWSGGTLAGTGTKTFNGQVNWSGGTLSAPTVAAGPLVVNPTVANAVTIDGATIRHTNNAGTSDWRGAADLRVVNNGVFQNEGNFRLNLGAGSANIVGDGTGIFRNQTAGATLLKQGAGTVNFGTAGNTVLFVNDGTTTVAAGTLGANGNATHLGTFDVTAGVLDFTGGAHVFAAGSRLQGAGTTRFSGGVHTVQNGAAVPDANLSVTGATLTYDAAGTTPGSVAVSGGTADFNTAVAIAGAANFTGGTTTFDAAGNTIAGAMTVTGGTLGGTGAVTANNGLTFTGGTLAGALTVPGATTLNAGTPQITGTLTGGSFDILGGSAVTIAAGGTLTSGAGGHAIDAASLTNNGTLALSGTWDLRNGATLTNNAIATWAGGAGGIVLAAGTTLTNAAAGTFNLNPTVTSTGITGAGTFANDGILNSNAPAGIVGLVGSVFNNANTVNVDGGVLRLTGGGNHGGAFAVDPGTTLEFGGGTHVVATVSGAGNLAVTAGAMTANGAVTHTGGLTVSGGAATFAANATPYAPNAITVSGGTATFDRVVTDTGPLTVSGGFAQFGAASTVAGASAISGGTLQGAGGVTIANTLALTGGTIADTLTVDGTTTVSGGTPQITGTLDTDVLNMTGGTLALAGTLIASANAPSTVTGGILNNAGTLRVSGGSSLTFSSLATLDNSSTLHAQAGSLVYSAVQSFNNGTSFTGVAGGNRVMSSSAFADAINSANLSLEGGNFSGTATLAGTTQWAGGTITGNFTIPAAATLNVNAAGLAQTGTLTVNGALAVANGAGLVNNGTLTVGGAGAVTVGAGAMLTNAAGRTLNLTALANNAGITGAGSFQNDGVLNSNAGSVDATLIATTFNNAGTTNVDGGTLRLTGGGAHGGTFAVDPVTTLAFGGGTHTVATVSGAGNLAVTAGAMTVNGAVTSTGGLTVSGGTVTFAANATPYAPGAIAVSGGTATFSRAVNDSGALSVSGGVVQFDQASSIAGASTLAGGTLQGTGALTINNDFGVSGGTIADNVAVTGTTTVTGGTPGVAGTLGTAGFAMTGGTLTVAAGGTVNATGAAARTIDNATLLNNGTFGFSGNGGLTLQNAASVTNNNVMSWNGGATSIALNAGTTLANAAGATLNLNATASGTGVTGAGAFANAGTVNVNAPGLVTLVSAPFTNAALVNVDAGTLRLTAGATHAGTFAVDAGTTLELLGGAHTLNAGGEINAAGSLTLNSSILNNAGTIALSGANGHTINGGTLNNNNALTIAGSGGLTIQNNGQLTNNAVATWAGPGSIGLSTGGALVNAPGATLNFNASTTNAGVTGTGAVANFGTLNVNAPGLTTLFGAPTNNAGVVNVDGGTLRLAGGGTDTGTFAVDPGTTLEFGGGTHNLNPGSAMTGAGAVVVSGGTLAVNTALTITNPFSLTGNGTTLGGTGNTTLSGAFAWSQGADIAGTGSLTTSGVTTLSDAGAGMASNWTNAAGGTVNMSPGAALEFFNTASTLTNQGAFNLPSAGATPISVASGSGSVVNQGVFNKAGAGTQSILTNAFTNAAGGALNVSAGTLAIPSLNANAGVITLSNDAVLTTNGANGINNTGTLQGVGTFNVGAGNAVVNDGFVAPGASPGTMTIAGDYTQGPLGTLLIELGGTQQGVTYDLLQVNGTANLGGNAVVSLVNGFVPQSTDSFTFMTYSSRIGDFARVTLPPAGSLQPFGGATTYRIAFPPILDDSAIREVQRMHEDFMLFSEEHDAEIRLPRGALECS